MKVWIAYREDDAVYQERSTIGIYATEGLAKDAADTEARRARDEEDKRLLHDPDDEEAEEVDWDVCTGVEGPFDVIEPPQTSIESQVYIDEGITGLLKYRKDPLAFDEGAEGEHAARELGELDEEDEA